MNFTYHEDGHRYELDGKKLTGVTTILGVLAKPALIGWAARMTAEWIRENCKECGLGPIEIDKIGGDIQKVFDVRESDLQEAIKAHTKKKEAGGEKGKDLHSEVEAYIKDCICRGGTWSGFTGATSIELNRFIIWAGENNVKFLSSETPVYSASWFAAGTPDFTFEKDGKFGVGDLKTYGKIWDKVPAYQMAAYAKMITEQTGRKVDMTCIVNIPKDGSGLTDQWFYDIESDTKCFEAALLLYRSLGNF